MSTIDQIKATFQTGDRPTQTQFENLIEAMAGNLQGSPTVVAPSETILTAIHGKPEKRTLTADFTGASFANIPDLGFGEFIFILDGNTVTWPSGTTELNSPDLTKATGTEFIAIVRRVGTSYRVVWDLSSSVVGQAPVLTNAEVGNIAATTVVLSYSKTLDGTSVPATSDYLLEEDTGSGFTAVSVTAVSLATAQQVRLTCTAINGGSTVRITYTPGTNPIRDTNNNLAGALFNQSINNNVGSSFSPADLGVKLLRWIHPNDAAQVVESGGILTSIGDKGTKNDNVVAAGTPNISGGVVTFDGVDDGLDFSTLFDTETNSEFFICMANNGGTFTGICGAEGATSNNFFRLGISNQGGSYYADCVAGSGTTQHVYADAAITNNTLTVIHVRTTGSAYVFNIDGTEYSGTDINVLAGNNDGDWVDVITSMANSTIGILRRTTSTFYAGQLGKPGFIETSALSAQERIDLINWMINENS